MPQRTDIKKVLIIIGQACEFDYSGTQACKALRESGYEVVLANSNPATIMTDPDVADHTYIEPLTVDSVEKIIERERPDALLPNLGGQTALNLAISLKNEGILAKYNVQLIGVDLDASERGEDRIEFKKTMAEIGVPMAKSEPSYSIAEAEAIAAKLGYPVVLRPAYTMGGTGGGIVYNVEELRDVVGRGLAASRINHNLIDKTCGKTASDNIAQFFNVVNDAAAGSAHRVSRTQNNGISQFGCDRLCFSDRVAGL